MIHFFLLSASSSVIDGLFGLIQLLATFGVIGFLLVLGAFFIGFITIALFGYIIPGTWLGLKQQWDTNKMPLKTMLTGLNPTSQFIPLGTTTTKIDDDFEFHEEMEKSQQMIETLRAYPTKQVQSKK